MSVLVPSTISETPNVEGVAGLEEPTTIGAALFFAFQIPSSECLLGQLFLPTKASSRQLNPSLQY